MLAWAFLEILSGKLARDRSQPARWCARTERVRAFLWAAPRGAAKRPPLLSSWCSPLGWGGGRGPANQTLTRQHQVVSLIRRPGEGHPCLFFLRALLLLLTLLWPQQVKYQQTEHAAARLSPHFKTTDHNKPFLAAPHFPVCFRIDFKILLLVFKGFARSDSCSVIS